jgi:DNA modification methylase
MEYKIINGDSLVELKKFPDNYFSSIVTDSPYGLGKPPEINELLTAWLKDGYMEIKGKGFMGKTWDAFVPQPVLWKEVYRVLKPGGHLLSFFGTRTYDIGTLAIRMAGFEIRDCIQWVFGSGFPKSLNVGIELDEEYCKISEARIKNWNVQHKLL